MKNEPALTFGALASLIVALLAVFHVVLDVDTVTAIIAAAVPLVSAILTRAKVTPVAKNV